MEFVAQTLEEILRNLRPIGVEWQDDVAFRVIRKIAAFPKKKIYEANDLRNLLEADYDDGLLICRLFLGLSKDQFHVALREALPDAGSGVTEFRKRPASILNALSTLGVLEAMTRETKS